MISLRRARNRDLFRVRELRNQASSRRWSGTKSPVPLWAHLRWWSARAERHESVFMICLDGDSVGYMRALREGSDTFRVSIAVDDRHRGRGIGAIALKGLITVLRNRYPGASVAAEIDENNVASLRAFGKAGFQQLGDYRDGSCAMIRLIRRVADEGVVNDSRGYI